VAIPLLEHCRTARVVALVVDASGQLRRALTVTDGPAAPSPALVRDVLTAALHHGGGGLALASNHPGGDPTPSEADRVLADAVSQGATSVGLRFVGSVVVAGRLWDEVPVPPRRAPAPG
jgi:DNA repair protein RadC